MLLFPLQRNSANEESDIKEQYCSPKWLASFCVKVQVLLKVCMFRNFSFAKQASRAEARLKNDCLHDQLTPVFAVLADHATYH